MSTRNHRSNHDRFNHQGRPAALALGVAALLGLSGLALAQPAPVSPGPPAFTAMDQNGDGQVSADEFGLFRAQRMAARAAEGRPLRNAAQAPTFASLDTNGDGSLTPAEVTEHQQARLASRGGGRGGGYGPGGGAGMAGRPCWRSQ